MSSRQQSKRARFAAARRRVRLIDWGAVGRHVALGTITNLTITLKDGTTSVRSGRGVVYGFGKIRA
jgi:hypothetical protein